MELLVKSSLAIAINSFKSLKSVDKKIQLIVATLTIHFVSSLLANSSFAIYRIFDSRPYLSDITGLFIFKNYLIIIPLLVIYFVVLKRDFLSTTDRETYIFSSILTMFVVTYFLKFYFVERLVELRSVSSYSLPNSITDFLPFNWFLLSYSYEAVVEGNAIEWNKIELFFTAISAIAVLLSIYFCFRYIKIYKKNIKVLFNVKNLINTFSSVKRRFVLALITVVFVFIGIENIKARDYSSIRMEVEFTQDDLYKFQEELIVANKEVFEFKKIDARKAAASKYFSSVSGVENRLSYRDFSFWSNDLRDLNDGIIEWAALWEEFLKEMSLKGFVEPEIVFDLNQKYQEVASLGQLFAPSFAEDYEIEFWEKEFKPLVS